MGLASNLEKMYILIAEIIFFGKNVYENVDVNFESS